MIWVIVAIVVVLLVVWLWSGERPPEIDPEDTTQAALELHAIKRRMEAAETRHELRRDGARLRRELAEELRDVD
jgi:hypothetical protein